MSSYPALFSGLTVNGLYLKNRVLMAPMATNMAAPDGGVTERLIAYYAERAKGGVGLVIVENANIDFPLGVNGAVQLRIDSDRYIPGLAVLREAMRDADPESKAALQLNHPGGQTKSARTEGRQVVGPSNVPTNPNGETPRPLTIEEIEQLVSRFAAAAERAKKAGFDAVEIHGGFCYLLAQFLSPRFNCRTDAYGGSIAGRAHFPVSVVKAVRKKVGPHFPILFRLNADEFIEGGTTLEQSREYAKILEAASVDLLHVTAGSGFSPAKHIEPMTYPQGWKTHLAAVIKKEVDIPVAAVGGIREPEIAEKILVRGDADCIALGRPLIADPYWVKKAGEGKPVFRCISCNVCAGRRLAYDLPIRCTVNPLVGCELRDHTRARLKAGLKILIIGGGPAGLKAALEAALDGHSVILAERESRLGGKGVIAAVPPGKDKALWLVEDLAREVRLRVRDIRLKTVADMNFIRKINPDYVIAAMGSEAVTPLASVETDNAIILLAETVLRDGILPVGKTIGVVGGGSVGCECAEYLAQNGNKVTLYEMREDIAIDADPITKGDLLLHLNEKNVTVKTGHKMREYRDGILTCCAGGKDVEDTIDMLVFAGGLRVYSPLVEELASSRYRHCVIGDCCSPGRFVDAVRQAYIAVEKLRCPAWER